MLSGISVTFLWFISSWKEGNYGDLSLNQLINWKEGMLSAVAVVLL